MQNEKQQTKNKLTITNLQQIECEPYVLLVSTWVYHQLQSLNVVLKYAKIQQKKINIRKKTQLHIITQLNIKEKKSAKNYPCVLLVPMSSIDDVDHDVEMEMGIKIGMTMMNMMTKCWNSDDGDAYGHGGDDYEMHGDDDDDDYAENDAENDTVNQMIRTTCFDVKGCSISS